MDTNIAEKVERYNEIGQVVRVTLRWRGKIYYLQMFFPGSKFPSRGEVETQVKKIYPDAVVMIHYASETQPNQPLIRVSEGRLKYGNFGNFIDGQKIEKKLEKKMKKVDYTKVVMGTNDSTDDVKQESSEKKKGLDGKACWKGYKLAGTKKKGGKTVDNCVPVKEEKENPTFVQFMQRIDQLPEVTRQAIKNCGDDPAIAKAALEISGIDK